MKCFHIIVGTIVLSTAIGGCGGFFLSTTAQTAAVEMPPIRIAVAANFAATIRRLVVVYRSVADGSIDISIGSTGSLYAQIEQGAPFDLFFAADARRPAMLEESGRAVARSRRTYAHGALALWSTDPQLINNVDILSDDGYKHLAIASPTIAPYGLAAQQALKRIGLWQAVQPRLVRAQSIGQTHQFINGGSAELGFVALSQIQQPDTEAPGSYIMVDPDLYDPIEQQVVVLTDSKPVREFWRWVTEDDTAQAIIRSYGYHVGATAETR